MNMRNLRTIPIKGGFIEVKALEYRTMSVFVYYGFLTNGHCVGYSKSLDSIKKRVRRNSP